MFCTFSRLLYAERYGNIQLPKGKTTKKTEEKHNGSIRNRKGKSMANRTDWNERTEITKAVITWFDADYEYELEIENEDRMDNEEFTAWVEENAESLAKADAESLHTVCEEIDSIDFTEKEIDDDALFDEEYENACEFEWVTPHGVGRCPEGTEGTGTC